MGKLLRMYPGQRYAGDDRRDRHEAVGCWIDYEGATDEEAAAIRSEARDLYLVWWKLLAELYSNVEHDHGFERWKPTGIGVPKEPWLAAA
jgi:hypothetical protein